MCRVAKYVSTLKQIRRIYSYYTPYYMYYTLFYMYHTLFYTYYAPEYTYLIRIYTYLFEHLICFGTTLHIWSKYVAKEECLRGAHRFFFSGYPNLEIQCFFLFKGLIIGISSYIGADSAAKKKHWGLYLPQLTKLVGFRV
jgi:hypothetical protein